MVVMALSTSSDSAMISAPREMRCRSMSAICMMGKTIASVSGNDRATIRPARPPSAAKLTTRMMAIACHSDSMNSPMAVSTTCGWFATSTGVMPTGRSAVMRATAASTFFPSASTSPPSLMEIASPIAGWPPTRNSERGGSSKPRLTVAMSRSRSSRPAATKLTSSRSCSEAKAPLTLSANCSRSVRTTPAGRTTFCAASPARIAAWLRPRLASRSVRNSRKICSSWAPIRSTLETSGTCRSFERTCST